MSREVIWRHALEQPHWAAWDMSAEQEAKAKTEKAQPRSFFTGRRRSRGSVSLSMLGRPRARAPSRADAGFPCSGLGRSLAGPGELLVSRGLTGARAVRERWWFLAKQVIRMAVRVDDPQLRPAVGAFLFGTCGADRRERLLARGGQGVGQAGVREVGGDRPEHGRLRTAARRCRRGGPRRARPPSRPNRPARPGPGRPPGRGRGECGPVGFFTWKVPLDSVGTRTWENPHIPGKARGQCCCQAAARTSARTGGA